jgi:hypothetical protein
VSGVAAANDLTARAPRGRDAELDGYAWLPRMLDKARATLAETAGGYPFGCPGDHTRMARLAIAPELVLDLAARHTDDHAVLDALRARDPARGRDVLGRPGGRERAARDGEPPARARARGAAAGRGRPRVRRRLSTAPR